MIQGSLLCLWMYKSSHKKLNLQLLSKEKLTIVNEQSTKLAVDDPTQVIKPVVLNSEGLLEYRFVFGSVFIL